MHMGDRGPTIRRTNHGAIVGPRGLSAMLQINGPGPGPAAAAAAMGGPGGPVVACRDRCCIKFSC